MEPDQLSRFQSALVIFGPETENSKEHIARPAKNCKFRRMGTSRCPSRALVIPSSSQQDVSRTRSGGATSYAAACGTGTPNSPRPPLTFAFSPVLVPSTLRAPETPVTAERPGAPIGKLPVELLSEIFIRCLPEIYFFLPRPTLAPMLLCQICAHWRQVALATPRLWVRLSVPARPYHNASYLLLLDLWMQRSFDHPLSLQFGSDIDLWGDYDPAFNIILGQARRWRYLSLALTEKIVGQFLTAFIGVTSPIQVLKLDVSACTAGQASQVVLTLNQFTRLRRLQFTRHTSTALLEAPWSQMTHIWLTCPLSDKQCFDILSLCSNVEDFRLSHITSSINSVFAPSRSIILPKLFFLQIHSAEDARMIFDNISCPSLRNLQLKRWGSCNQPSAFFTTFLSRSGCKLESFLLHDDEVSEDDLINHLRAPLLKQLRTLELECRRLGRKTLKVLSDAEGSADSGNVLLPSLHSIWFKYAFLLDDGLNQMVESRLGGTMKQPDGMVGPSLKNVFVGKHRHPVCRDGKMLKTPDTVVVHQVGQRG